MEKKNIQPQQQKPVVRPTVAKPAIEEGLTSSWSGASGAIAPSFVPFPFPFAGDDAE